MKWIFLASMWFGEERAGKGSFDLDFFAHISQQTNDEMDIKHTAMSAKAIVTWRNVVDENKVVASSSNQLLVNMTKMGRFSHLLTLIIRKYNDTFWHFWLQSIAPSCAADHIWIIIVDMVWRLKAFECVEREFTSWVYEKRKTYTKTVHFVHPVWWAQCFFMNSLSCDQLRKLTWTKARVFRGIS